MSRFLENLIVPINNDSVDAQGCSLIKSEYLTPCA
jgi:hypothetical protein